MSGSARKWDIPWNAPAALIDFAKLEAEEIAVSIQIINLIYAQGGPIENDPEAIKTYIKKMGRKTCEKVIHNLIHKGAFVLENNKIISKKCAEILKKREESFQTFSLFGKKGAETKAKNKQNQDDLFSPPKDGLQPDSSITSSSDSSLKTSLPSLSARGVGSGGFSIFDVMTEEGEREARRAAPGWDLRHLCGIFDGKVRAGTFTAPNDPDTAFPAWCAKYTKGKPPR